MGAMSSDAALKNHAGDAALKTHAGDAATSGDANVHRFCRSCHVNCIKSHDITSLMMYTDHDSLPI